MVTIRALTSADAQSFKNLRLQAIDNSPTSIWPTRGEVEAQSTSEITARIHTTPTQTVFGAFIDNTLVGITGVRREPLSQVSHKAIIWGVFVDPTQRGKGIAQDMLRVATEHALHAWGCLQLTLCVNAENTPAKRLYTSQGFVTFGVEPRAMQVGGRFYDEEYMVKKLR
ncbi:GNAT family N-acetyltransferase [Chromobacterium violaceum]|uniref:GNAT family N-acetyltransferase n=1 Tax=Chromobacterium violaceum TaxID=536 RepID=UPI001B32ED51|nr:GNAT family N-acetyltransferase [Chromobacterium violaceum]MBP4046837.1 GNAT family N-acetyltransferase [Chromobacterium violaceum]